MKKKVLAILAVIALCSMCFVGIASAAKAGYQFSIGSGTAPTTDGIVAADEWNTDSYKDFLYNGWAMTTSSFRCKWAFGDTVNEYFLIEVLSDTTDSAGDIFQLTYDGGEAPDGGAAPNANDFKIQLTGHNAATGAQVFVGTGTAWGASAAARGTDWEIATSMASGHWVIELWINKQGVLALAMNSNNLRISAFDAGASQTLMWPPESSADVPDTWGTGATSFEAIPEGLTIGLMLAVSSVAVVVGARYFKKPKI